MSGIDLLMNASKKSNSGSRSDAMSVRSDVSSVDRRPPQPSAAPAPATVPTPAPPPASPSTPAAMYFHQRQPEQPVQQQKQKQQTHSDSDDDDSDDEDEEDDEEDGSEDDEEDGSEKSGPVRPRYSSYTMTPEQVLQRKREILYQFDRIERKGVQLPNKFTMSDTLEDMSSELERLKLDREVDMSIRFQRKMLMTCVTGIELLNSKFDPFDIKLDGWSDSLHEQVNDYDDVFEELHMKYRDKAKMAPELKLLFMVGGSGVMFHLTSSMFKSMFKATTPPDFEQVMRQNPALMQQYTQAAMQQQGFPVQSSRGPQVQQVQAQQGQQQQAQQSQSQRAPAATSGAGNMFSMLGSLFGGQGQSQAQGPLPPPQPSDAGRMRGPKHVDDYLRDLHRDAFPSGSQQQQQQQQHQQDNARIEIISNASESELSEIPDDTASALLGESTAPSPSARAPRKRAPRTKAA
jgi:hypothetical protein